MKLVIFFESNQINDIEAPTALDVRLALPERGKFYLAAIPNGGKKTFRQH